MWEIIQLSFDSWIGVAALLMLVLVLAALPFSRPYASGLLLPAVLLFLRKALLYLPVLGAVSTEDKVMFWSTAALFCYSISLLSAACIILWIIKPTSWEDSNLFQRGARFVGVLGPWISAGALGAIGWSIPFVAALSLSGAFKVLIVSPALFPVTVTAIFVHLLRGCFAGALLSREINKAVADPRFSDRLVAQGMEIVGSTPEQMHDVMRVDFKRWGDLIKTTGATAPQ